MDVFTWEFWLRPVDLGTVVFSPASLLLGGVLVCVLLLVQGWVKRLLVKRLFPRLRVDAGMAHSLATLLGYLFLAIGLLLILPVAFPGFSFTTLSVVLGAVSFGIGFGLRNIADNFVSGLIILFERPIKVGDRIALGELTGDVKAISARSTRVRTNDNIEIIVPNSQFIAEQVINWSHGDRMVRFRIPVGVHYNSDVKVVKQALEEAGRASANVLTEPPPSAKFVGFGDSSLNFELWVWTTTMSARPRAFISEVNYLIWDHLKTHKVEIPYPQRDIYVKEVPSAEGGRTGLPGVDLDEPRQGTGL
ncbi:MAG: mechanosensitive ion channel family protein [Opitutales bacterium]